jgi:hypothetical protein
VFSHKKVGRHVCVCIGYRWKNSLGGGEKNDSVPSEREESVEEEEDTGRLCETDSREKGREIRAMARGLL